MEKYLPITFDRESIILGKDQIEVKILSYYKHKCSKGFFPVRKEEVIKISDALAQKHWVHNVLRENFGEDPLKLWNKSPRFCELKLKNSDVIIRVKPMIYTRTDINKFDIQLKELQEKGLIETWNYYI